MFAYLNDTIHQIQRRNRENNVIDRLRCNINFVIQDHRLCDRAMLFSIAVRHKDSFSNNLCSDSRCYRARLNIFSTHLPFHCSCYPLMYAWSSRECVKNNLNKIYKFFTFRCSLFLKPSPKDKY